MYRFINIILQDFPRISGSRGRHVFSLLNYTFIIIFFLTNARHFTYFPLGPAREWMYLIKLGTKKKKSTELYIK